jgi:hypothetical protein
MVLNIWQGRGKLSGWNRERNMTSSMAPIFLFGLSSLSVLINPTTKSVFERSLKKYFRDFLVFRNLFEMEKKAEIKDDSSSSIGKM